MNIIYMKTLRMKKNGRHFTTLTQIYNLEKLPQFINLVYLTWTNTEYLKAFSFFEEIQCEI